MKRTITPIEVSFKFPFGDQIGKVNAFLVVDGEKAVLIDSFVAGHEDLVEEALTAVGLTWSDLTDIIITHGHPDHAGSLPAILEHASQAIVHANDPLDDVARVQSLIEGDTIFGLRIIAVPGHTAGSIALYDTALSALFVGDAATNINYELGVAPPMFTADSAQAKISLIKLADTAFETAYFGHGTTIRTDATTKFKQFANSL